MYVKDVFYSIQGEGVYVGKPQIFVRFFGCNIHCAYCDEPDFEKDKINQPREWVLSQIEPFRHRPLHSVSMTGGEPLLHTKAIRDLHPDMPAPLFLETNVTLPDRLAEIKDVITYFSVDYKPGYESAFEESMAILKDEPHVYVKYILMSRFKDSELDYLAGVMKKYPTMPVILQPVTPFAEVLVPASESDIFRGVDLLAGLTDVRVIGQTHKFMGLK
jgi:7-carboxy-7-deazaguanine synthase